MDGILGKAKSLLAAERDYFKDNETHPRFVVEESGKKDLQVTVRLFLEAQVCLDEKAVLPVTDFMDGLKNYLRDRGTSLPKDRELKTIVQETIRKIHGKGFRNDLVLADGRSAQGWKGLCIGVVGQNETRAEPGITKMTDSGVSDLSDPIEVMDKLPQEWELEPV